MVDTNCSIASAQGNSETSPELRDSARKQEDNPLNKEDKIRFLLIFPALIFAMRTVLSELANIALPDYPPFQWAVSGLGFLIASFLVSWGWASRGKASGFVVPTAISTGSIAVLAHWLVASSGKTQFWLKQLFEAPILWVGTSGLVALGWYTGRQWTKVWRLPLNG